MSPPALTSALASLASPTLRRSGSWLKPQASLDSTFQPWLEDSSPLQSLNRPSGLRLFATMLEPTSGGGTPLSVCMPPVRPAPGAVASDGDALERQRVEVAADVEDAADGVGRVEGDGRVAQRERRGPEGVAEVGDPARPAVCPVLASIRLFSIAIVPWRFAMPPPVPALPAGDTDVVERDGDALAADVAAA